MSCINPITKAFIHMERDDLLRLAIPIQSFIVIVITSSLLFQIFVQFTGAEEFEPELPASEQNVEHWQKITS